MAQKVKKIIKPIEKDVEVELKPDDLLVSKTDPKGRITYANRCFMRVAGYSERELIGQPHNIIRHSEMPRGVFRVLWNTLQGGEEFFGFVKNNCADGSFYWVFANVTLDLDKEGQVQGYYSVRRYAPKSAINICEEIYEQMRKKEAQVSGNSGIDQSVAYLNDCVKKIGNTYKDAMMALYIQK